MDGMDTYKSYSCAGVAWRVQADSTGTWLNHILAGVALLLWALHWNLNVFRAWLTQTTKQRPFQSKATYPILFLPERWPIEPLLKIIVPAIGMLCNVIGSDGWKSNTCGESTPRAGHFDPQNIFRYANIWTLFAFMASGFIDLLGFFLELPEGTETFFTAVPFMLQSFLLVSGQYTDMLEDMVYYMLFLLSAGTALFLLAEIAWPHSFLTSCGRVYCMYMHSIWLFSAAHILHEGRVAWDSRHPLPDMAPSAFVPVPFVLFMNVTSLAMFLGYLIMRAVLKQQGYDLLSDGSQEAAAWGLGSGFKTRTHRAAASSSSKETNGGTNELVPLVARNI